MLSNLAKIFLNQYRNEIEKRNVFPGEIDGNRIFEWILLTGYLVLIEFLGG